VTEQQNKHPYAGVDIAGLDDNLVSLLEYAARPDDTAEKGNAPGQGLSHRERGLFRFGMFAGLGEWDLARDAIGSLLKDRAVSSTEAERALVEATLVKGVTVSIHLRAPLVSLGVGAPADTLEAAKAVKAERKAGSKTQATPGAGLTERDLFALGLGITWGVRCWDT
jgi:hypothetical protein